MNRLIDRYYKLKGSKSLDNCQGFTELACTLGRQNSQSYLAWEDALNKISTIW